MGDRGTCVGVAWRHNHPPRLRCFALPSSRIMSSKKTASVPGSPATPRHTLPLFQAHVQVLRFNVRQRVGMGWEHRVIELHLNSLTITVVRSVVASPSVDAQQQ